MSFAKQITFDRFDHHSVLRFQVIAFNIFNILQLQPITNGNASAGANIQSANFGYAQGADAGRVIEFLARVQFQAPYGVRDGMNFCPERHFVALGKTEVPVRGVRGALDSIRDECLIHPANPNGEIPRAR